MSNTRRTEGKGITAVNQFVLNSPLLTPFLDFNDRTDSWDGNIFVYSDTTNKKTELAGKVPVQVKTSEVEAFSGEYKTISLGVADLRNYRNDGGIILFGVECCGNDTQIYYASLLPYDLVETLKSLPKVQKTRNVRLKRLDNTNELEDVLNDFLLHRKRQFSLDGFVFPEDQIQEVMLQGHVPGHTSIEEKLLSKPQYLYGKKNANSLVWDCVVKVHIEAIRKLFKKPIQLGGRVFYEQCDVVEKLDSVQYIPNKNVKIEIKGYNLKIYYRLSGTLAEQRNDAHFLLTLVTEMLAEKNDMMPNQEEFHEFLVDLRDIHDYLNNIAALLDIFGVAHDKVQLDLSKEQTNVVLLINTLVLNKPFPRPDKLPGIFRFRVGNISLLTFIEEKNSQVQVHDFNILTRSRMTLVLESGKGQSSTPLHEDVSPYMLLNSDDIRCANIDLPMVIQDVMSFPHGPLYDSHVLSLCLQMITAYDKTQDRTFLDGAEKLLQWIDSQYVNEDILLINRLQIIRRKREYNAKELDILYKLKGRYADDTRMLCGVSILLGDLALFDRCYQVLSDTDKKDFRESPIVHLLPQHVAC